MSLSRLLILLLPLATFGQSMSAQNLIPNAGFENYSSCPEGLNPFPLDDWISPTRGNPDYFNTCALEGDKGFAVPDNYIGTEKPFRGSGFAGITMHSDFPTIVEYIQIQLKEKLIENEVYHFCIYVSLAEKSEYAIANWAVQFRESAFHSDQWERLPPNDMMINLGAIVIKQIDGWRQLQGFYQAKGGESHLVLGNFSTYSTVNKRTTGFSGKGDAMSYYYVDNISLSKVFPSQSKVKIATSDSLTSARKLYSRFVFRESKGAMDIRDIYFPENSEVFYVDCKMDLDKVVELLNEYPAMAVDISGHCDRAAEEGDIELSEKRAESIASYFRKHNIDKKRISFRGYSSNHPSVEETNTYGQQENRRVELQITKYK